MMLTYPRLMLCSVLAALLLAGPLPADDKGQADLDKATELKLTASSLDDIGKVAELCESALEKGLGPDNEAFARQLLTGSLFQRADLLSRPVLEPDQRDRRWPLFRRESMKDLERILKVDPAFGDAHLLVARLQLMPNGDAARAKSALEKAAEIYKDDPQQLSRVCVYRAQTRTEDEARKADLDEAVRLDPKNAEAWEARAQFHIARDDFKAAVEDLRQIIAGDADNFAAEVLLVESLLKIEQFDEALEHANKAVELAPDLSAGYYLRARAYLMKDQAEPAIESLDSALRVDPGDPMSRLLRSQVLASLGDFDRAVADMLRVLEIAPDDIQLRMQLAMYYNAGDDPHRAVEEYTRVLEADEGNWQALRGRGDALLNMGEHAKAIADYDAALKANAADSGLLNNLAWVLATSPDDQLRDGTRALELGKKACEQTNYEKAHILSTLAAAYAELGDFESALKWSTKAVELGDPDNLEHLKQEVESYKQKKPWRERLEKGKKI